jgi:hypothetical protein
MQQDNNEPKPGNRNFYTYPGGNAGEQPQQQPEPASEEKKGEATEAAAPQTTESQNLPVTPNPEETPEDGGKKRKKLLFGLLITVLLAAALCGAGYLIEKFATAGSSGSVSSGSGISGVDATLYLKSLSWEKKSHDTLKPLTKMKNLRYALQFFENYTPEQIAAVDSAPSSLTQAMQDYKHEVGTLVSMQANVEQKVPVTEEIETGSSTPSILLSISEPGAAGDASMLVVGSTLDDIQPGDEISFRCIPLYCYLPKDTEGGLFLITAPELVEKK